MANIQRTSHKAKLERIDLRTTAKIKSTLAYAAELSGISMSNFLIEAACEKATQLIQEQELLVLTNKERDKFLTLLETSPDPVPKLKVAMQQYLSKGG